MGNICGNGFGRKAELYRKVFRAVWAVRKYNKIKRGAPNRAPLSHKAPQCGAFSRFQNRSLRCTLRGVFAVLGEREGRKTPVTEDFSRWTFRGQSAKPPFSAAQKSAFGSAAIFGADRAYFIPVNKISKCFSHNFRLFLTISALFHLLSITLQTQCPRILHTALWQKMWSDSPRWNHYRS